MTRDDAGRGRTGSNGLTKSFTAVFQNYLRRFGRRRSFVKRGINSCFSPSFPSMLGLLVGQSHVLYVD